MAGDDVEVMADRAKEPGDAEQFGWPVVHRVDRSHLDVERADAARQPVDDGGRVLEVVRVRSNDADEWFRIELGAARRRVDRCLDQWCDVIGAISGDESGNEVRVGIEFSLLVKLCQHVFANGSEV